MKNVLATLLALVLLSCSVMCVSAAKETTVYGENISILKGAEKYIPVKIKNNNGIMGFKITLDYDPKIVEITSLTAGDLTCKGNFVSNLGDKKGHIDVIWSYYEDIKDSGVLFSIRIKALKEDIETTDIKIGYSKDDTFNSKWEDVILKCANIIITEGKNPNTENGAVKQETVTNKQLLNAVGEVVSDLGFNSINDIKDTEAFVEKVNKNIEEKTGVHNYANKGFKSLRNEYYNKRSNEIKKNLLKNVDALKLKNSVDNALNGFGVSSVKEVDDKDKEAFVKDVQSNLLDEYPDANNISDDLGYNEAIKLIDKVHQSVKNTPENTTILIILIILIVVFCISIVFAIFIKHNKKKKTK